MKNSKISSVSFTLDDKIILSSSDSIDKSIKLYNVSDGSLILTILTHNKEVTLEIFILKI
jgi:WD40 repeat protein